MLAYFAQLPIALTGFRFGFMPAAVAAAIATLAVGVASPGAGALTLFLLTSVVPVLLIVYLALQCRTAPDGTEQWYPLGRILAWLAALAVAVLAIAMLMFSGAEDGLEGTIRRYLQGALSGFGGMDPETIDATVAMTTRLFPGIAATSWMFMNVINGILALRLVTATGHNQRPKPSFHDIEVPNWPIAVIVVGAVLSFFGGNPALLGTNAMIVATVPFFFIGLAVLHSISAAWPGRIMVLTGVYLLLVLLLWPAVFIALLGIAENWLRLRDRANARRANKGNE